MRGESEKSAPPDAAEFDRLKAVFKIVILTALILSLIWPVRSWLASPPVPAEATAGIVTASPH